MHKFVKSFYSNYDGINKYYKYLIKKTKTDDIDRHFINSFYIVDEYKKYIKQNEKEISTMLNNSSIYGEVKKNISNYNYNITYQLLIEELKKKEIEYTYEDLNLIIISVIMIYAERLNVLSKELIKKNNVRNSVIDKMNDSNFSSFNLKDYEVVYTIDQELRRKNSNFKKFNVLLEKNNIVLKDIIDEVNKKKAVNSLIINNIYDSLYSISSKNEDDIVSELSKCEKILNKDIIYSSMDSDMKKLYRKRIVEISKKEKLSESEFISSLINKKEHIGNNLFTYKDDIMVSKKPIFKMNYSNKIVSSFKIVVVIPIIVNNTKEITNAYKKFETLYLSNNCNDNIYFTLICNVKNSNKKVLNDDKKYASFGMKTCERLNKKYKKSVFNFIYRKRIFDNNIKKYIGYKDNNELLISFNKLLNTKFPKNEDKVYFSINTLKDIKDDINYVVSTSIDSDIKLDSIVELVSYISHPLNKAILNNDNSKVIYGFGMIKPRINGGRGLFDNSIYDLEIVNKLNNINATNLRCGYISDIEILKEDYNLVNNLYKPDNKEMKEIMGVAKRLWNYYSENLISENNYLIPNNFQEKRKEKFDYKTTPTDIAYSLTSVVSAYELGFIELDSTIDYLKNILEVIDSLEKCNGHLYNYYNSKTKEVIYPRIVSTKDSSSLVASLMLTKGFLLDKEKTLVKLCEKLIDSMDFKFLNDNGLFSIGYLKDEDRLLKEKYNSVSLTSFISIVKQDISYKHWNILNINIDDIDCINSSIYELLLFTNNYNNSFINSLYNDVYNYQRKYLKVISKRLPWGIGNSYYNELDENNNYKYNEYSLMNNDRVVISPYSSLMAFELFPKDVCKNIIKLKQLNMLFKYGFYDAYDYNSNNVVRACLSYHQGMSLMGITNYIKDRVLKKYFYKNINVDAYDYLLSEKNSIRNKKTYKKKNMNKAKAIRKYNLKDISKVNVLTNTKYSLIMDNDGNSYYRFKTVDICKCNSFYKNRGLFLYIKDIDTNKVWSNTYAPTYVMPKMYDVEFSLDKTRYNRCDEDITTITDIKVLEEDSVEIRKVTFINNSNIVKKLELTSYMEPFINESIKTIIDEDSNSYIAFNNNVYMFNRLLIDGKEKNYYYENDKNRFIGNNRNLKNPISIYNRLSSIKESGNILSIRNRIELGPNSKKEVYLLCGFGKNMNQLKSIIKKYDNRRIITDSFKISKYVNDIRNINYTEKEIDTYNAMINYLCQKDNILINDDLNEKLEDNTLTKKNLLKFDVSGDKPIILISITSMRYISYIYEVLKAYLYFKNRNVYVDIIIINSIKDNSNDLNEIVNSYKYQIYNEYGLNDNTGIIKVIDKDRIKYKERLLLEMYSIMNFSANSKGLKNEIDSYVDSNILTKYENDTLQDVKNSAEFNEYKLNNNELVSVIKSNGCSYTYYNGFMLSSERLMNDRSEAIKINNEVFNPEICENHLNYIVFRNDNGEYKSELIEFIPNNENVKVFLCKINNKTDEVKNVDISLSINPILNIEDGSNILLSEFKKGENYLGLRNEFNNDYKDLIVFLSSSERIKNVSYKKPLMKEIGISIKIDPLEEKEIVFTLGCARGDLNTLTLVYKYKKLNLVTKELDILKNSKS